MIVIYNKHNIGEDQAESSEYQETINIKYMVNDSKFYIFENVKNNKNQEYDRVWIIEQVLNRPYFMRITYLAQMLISYQQARNGAQLLI